MTKQEIITKVKALHLPMGSYVVFGSGPLAVAGIREANDIDLLVNEKVIEELKAKGWKQVYKGELDEPFVRDDIEAHANWNFSKYSPTLEHLLASAIVVEEVPFASLEEVLKWKQASGLAKHDNDIKTLQTFFSSKWP